MITSEEYDQAIQLIANYNLQLDKQTKMVLLKNKKVNIQEDIKEKTFRVLQKYYQQYYDTKLQWEDLKVLDRDLLKSIDYNKIKLIKGYDQMSQFNLKKLMIYHSIIETEE